MNFLKVSNFGILIIPKIYTNLDLYDSYIAPEFLDPKKLIKHLSVNKIMRETDEVMCPCPTTSYGILLYKYPTGSLKIPK